ncbi:hypothetical protein AYI68_g4670 [Smittium mucronatum]|uniref:Uncharacterized protein n=1 Tax=Smittium mucronatum TaxID=133383 RepID=A0A1R0GWG1_9FUNG|nr:hypothetical protein AYI68_g4670 [Smittium mucronatum]
MKSSQLKKGSKEGKRRIEKTIILTSTSSCFGLPAVYPRENGEIYQPKDPPGIASSRCMTEVTGSQELSSLSTKISSLKLMSS